MLPYPRILYSSAGFCLASFDLAFPKSRKSLDLVIEDPSAIVPFLWVSWTSWMVVSALIASGGLFYLQHGAVGAFVTLLSLFVFWLLFDFLQLRYLRSRFQKYSVAKHGGVV